MNLVHEVIECLLDLQLGMVKLGLGLVDRSEHFGLASKQIVDGLLY